MTNIITIYMTLVPGVMCLYWISELSDVSIRKFDSQLLIILSALMLLPIILANMLIINIINSLIKKWSNFNPFIDWSVSGFFDKMNTIPLSVWFLIVSMFTSFFIARIYVTFIAPQAGAFLDKQREKLGYVGRSPGTPWSIMFSKQPKCLLEIYNIDNPNKKIAGTLIKANESENGRSVILRHINKITEMVKKDEYPIDKTYIDISSGLVINKLKFEEDD